MTIMSLQPKQMQLAFAMYERGLDAATTLGAGGARAGGKSGGLRRIMLERRLKLPGTPGAIVRRIWEDLRINHVEKYFEEIPELRQYYRSSDHEIRLPNGSVIAFRYAENQTAVDQKFWGPEYYDIFVEQAEQFNERELITIKTCNRWPSAPPGDCKMAMFFNPGGIGTEYLRRVFAQKRFNSNERPGDYKFIHMFGWDNFEWFRHLMKPEEFYAIPSEQRFELFITKTSEGQKLNSLPKSLRAGHLLGSFDSFAGQYFAGVWDESRLILTAEQEAKLLQPWWPRWMSHDAGFVHHASLLWWASGKVSPERFKDIFGVNVDQEHSVVVVYRNLTLSETEEGELLRRAIALTPEIERKVMRSYELSPDAWEKDSKGHSPADTIAEELRRCKMPMPTRADNNRVGGWRFLYAMMKKTADVLAGKWAPTRQNEDYDAVEGSYSLKTPLLFIGPMCQDVIESVPLAVRDDKHPGKVEDVLKQATKADDVNDSLRYGGKAMLNPLWAPPIEVQAQELYAGLTQQGVSEHSKAMAIMKFNAENKTKRRSSWVR